jgi:cyclin-dependent kinase 8/11
MDASVRRAHTEDRRAQQALYEKEGFVGEGAFGVVMKAVVKQHTQTTGATGTAASQAAPQQQAQQPPAKKQYVAIKQMMNQREGQGISLDAYREIKILKELRHENIVSLERIFTRPDKHEVDLVYEYADHDLAEVIKSNRARMSQEHVQPDARFVKSVLQQILLGLAFLHGNWVMHRDLKPANILVTKTDSTASNEKKGEREAGEGGGVIKLADFGLARIFQSPLRKLADDGEVVTIWYRAPELLLGSKHYTRAIDIFAAGCIFFELLTCQPLFPGSEKPGKVFQENQVKEVFKSLGQCAMG